MGRDSLAQWFWEGKERRGQGGAPGGEEEAGIGNGWVEAQQGRTGLERDRSRERSPPVISSPLGLFEEWLAWSLNVILRKPVLQ